MLWKVQTLTHHKAHVVLKLRMTITKSRVHSLWLGTNVSWRETHCFTFQECLGVRGWFLLCFFLFWEPKRLFSGKSGQQAGLVLRWCLNTPFLKQQLLSREEIFSQRSRFLLWCHAAGFIIFGFFSRFKKLPRNEKKTSLGILHYI